MTIDPEVHGGESTSVDNLGKVCVLITRHRTTPGRRRTAYSQTVGLSGLEWQGSIIVEPDVAGGWRHRRGSGCNRWDVSVSLSEIHQRCIRDRFSTTRVGDGHEVFEQGVVFRVVPVNIRGQALAGVRG